MTRPRLAPLIALLLGFLLAAPATRADEPSTIGEAEATATDGLLYEAVRKADEFWRSVGLDPGEAYVCVFTSPDYPAKGTQLGHKVCFERWFVRRIREDIASRCYRTRRAAYEELFRKAVHERGHNLDLTHKDGGVMAVDGSRVRTPGIGLAWAREKAGPYRRHCSGLDHHTVRHTS